MNTQADRNDALPSARERILYTAHELFYRDGVRATGIDRVIAESGVTKVTFYRHFPSKNDLIRAYLAYRHTRWMAWFTDALARHGGGAGAIVPAVEEWFRDACYRGCAFINSVGELGGTLPDVIEIAYSHKQDMAAAIAAVLPKSRQRAQIAQAVALAIDGAIVRAQFDPSPNAALAALRRIINALLKA
ncbi:TetR/AcrR family transcriptional regulator [Thiobacillus sp.]|uniref:TetR/AcrR family transcriptional regulator n=1 Tax=Thiobacillus sp. TaxID=924 RepID=UPI0011D7FBC3|nr:TetR/AcrR family transcriptional regulator [Thiobacillus sp.]TXH75477.1 MAG: TetR/AcrR family transcriptional regulator [Thiobacillus sp.]